MSRRWRGAVGREVVRGRLALPARAYDVGARHDDRAGAAVVAHREVLPVGQQGLGVGPEHPPDVGGVVLGGVEVDVVADRERQQHRHRVHRRERGLDEVPLGLVGEQARHPRPGGLPHRRSRGHERVEGGLVEQLVGVDHVRGRDDAQVERPGRRSAPPPAAVRRSARTRRRAGGRRRTRSPRLPRPSWCGSSEWSCGVLHESEGDQVVKRLRDRARAERGEPAARGGDPAVGEAVREVRRRRAARAARSRRPASPRPTASWSRPAR